MAFNINDFKARGLQYGGARSSLFRIIMANPVDSSANAKLTYTARAAALPASQLGQIEVPYFGRKIKIAGERTFEPWTITVVNDEDFLVRNAMEKWSAAINSHVGNVTSLTNGELASLEYKTDAEVEQYSKSGALIRRYTFKGIFPTNVSSIDLDWNTTDSLQEFSVEFQYDWWEVSSGQTGLTVDVG